MSASALHVVFGGGQIGPLVAEQLVAEGHRVRLVRRQGDAPPGVEPRLGDARDAGFATAACEGAAAIYHCINVTYSASAWARDLPRVQQALVAVAGRARARLVVLDNVYAFGRPGGRPLDEDRPIAPCSRKGEVRARLDAGLWEAHRRGDVRAVVGRASDFYGPRGTATHFGDAFWPDALEKGRARMLVNLDTPHTYHYTHDVAAGLRQLGTAAGDVEGRWWMLPCAPAEPTRALLARLARPLGGELEVRSLSPRLQRLLGAFGPVLRELGEMAYQWEEPFVMDDRRFRERFGAEARATTLDAGMLAAEAWARPYYEWKRAYWRH